MKNSSKSIKPLQIRTSPWLRQVVPLRHPVKQTLMTFLVPVHSQTKKAVVLKHQDSKRLHSNSSRQRIFSMTYSNRVAILNNHLLLQAITMIWSLEDSSNKIFSKLILVASSLLKHRLRTTNLRCLIGLLAIQHLKVNPHNQQWQMMIHLDSIRIPQWLQIVLLPVDPYPRETLT